jgi:hypothetical protein
MEGVLRALAQRYGSRAVVHWEDLAIGNALSMLQVSFRKADHRLGSVSVMLKADRQQRRMEEKQGRGCLRAQPV